MLATLETQNSLQKYLNEVYKIPVLTEEEERKYAQLKEGKETGLKEGETIGLEKGKEAGKLEEKIDNIRKMKECGVDIHIISTVTGLSADEIEKL